MHLLSHSLSRLGETLRLPLLMAAMGGILVFTGCGSKEEAEAAAKASPTPADIIAQKPKVHGIEIKTVEMTKPLKADWVAKGKATYEMKCLACHKLTGDRVVGPGWAGVTKRRQPVWIMNMITNVDMMLEKDAEAQKLLEMCLVRMPNMNVTTEEARQLFEYMRHNDGES
jgi:mono/diheme cytochrome c family protein